MKNTATTKLRRGGWYFMGKKTTRFGFILCVYDHQTTLFQKLWISYKTLLWCVVHEQFIQNEWIIWMNKLNWITYCKESFLSQLQLLSPLSCFGSLSPDRKSCPSQPVDDDLTVGAIYTTTANRLKRRWADHLAYILNVSSQNQECRNGATDAVAVVVVRFLHGMSPRKCNEHTQSWGFTENSGSLFTQ